MIIYAGILMGVTWISILVHVAARKPVETLSTLIAHCISLPLYGRIFGWW